MPSTNDCIQSEMQESRRVLAHLSGEDISASPLWHKPGSPTYYGALLLADSIGAERIKEMVQEHRRVKLGMLNITYTAVVWTKTDNGIRAGAATSKYPQVARELAFRNAIKQLI